MKTLRLLKLQGRYVQIYKPNIFRYHEKPIINIIRRQNIAEFPSGLHNLKNPNHLPKHNQLNTSSHTDLQQALLLINLQCFINSQKSHLKFSLQTTRCIRFVNLEIETSPDLKPKTKNDDNTKSRESETK